ncbi:Cyclic nucleotide-binding domain protein [Candidatus Rhodobacter oscarellae]|uniref:Cyclic nucleotide-binding domain protein n=1 Tax=Candidatus Rhodobacter oscarellae TaxID=1675527 RepID=A0A0J9E763_9RHOB|nr:Crp/Fnr family transcriptional regulator [Candidatus Rhodobacter lobularis]KMW58546.1 Cyclic nucleotide-binding domain protein [Candidatus Rhodobacter lobularis]
MPTFEMQPDFFVYAAGALFITGYLIINQVILRLIVIFGTFFYIAYYATVAEAPLWGAIYMSSAQGTALLIGLLILVGRNTRLAIPRRFQDLYPRFSHLPPGDFRALMRRGRRYMTETEEVLGREGAPVDRLVYVISGVGQVRKRGERFTVPPGVFIGEVAYLMNRGSAATTTLPEGSEIIAWDKAVLDAASAKSPRFRLALEAAISRDMAAKVALAVAPGDMRQNAPQGFDTGQTAP